MTKQNACPALEGTDYLAPVVSFCREEAGRCYYAPRGHGNRTTDRRDGRHHKGGIWRRHAQDLAVRGWLEASDAPALWLSSPSHAAFCSYDRCVLPVLPRTLRAALRGVGELWATTSDR